MVSTILVIGATGYLGRALCAAITGHRVVAASRSGTVVPGTEHHALDVRDRDAVTRTVAKVAPTVIINCAYVQDGPDARLVNTDGAGYVAEAAARVGARLVHMSSDVVFDGVQVEPLTEDSPLTPVNDYGRTKADGEGVVRHHSPEAAIVRTSLIYGGPTAAISSHEVRALDAAKGRSEMTFYSDELRCPVQVDDLARALVALAASNYAGPLHIAGPRAVSRHQFARAVARGFGLPTNRLRRAEAPPGRPLRLALDCSRLRDALPGIRMRDIDEVLSPLTHRRRSPRDA